MQGRQIASTTVLHRVTVSTSHVTLLSSTAFGGVVGVILYTLVGGVIFELPGTLTAFAITLLVGVLLGAVHYFSD